MSDQAGVPLNAEPLLLTSTLSVPARASAVAGCPTVLLLSVPLPVKSLNAIVALDVCLFGRQGKSDRAVLLRLFQPGWLATGRKL